MKIAKSQFTCKACVTDVHTNTVSHPSFPSLMLSVDVKHHVYLHPSSPSSQPRRQPRCPFSGAFPVPFPLTSDLNNLQWKWHHLSVILEVLFANPPSPIHTSPSSSPYPPPPPPVPRTPPPRCQKGISLSNQASVFRLTAQANYA